MSAVASIVVGLRLNRRFDYEIPETMEVLVGTRVIVPFHGRLVTGYVVELKDQSTFEGKLKAVHECLDQKPTFNPELMTLVGWAADYYQVPLGELMRKALPPSLHSVQKKRVRITTAGKEQAGTSALLDRLSRGGGELSWKNALGLASAGSIAQLQQQGLLDVLTGLQSGSGNERYSEVISRTAKQVVTRKGKNQLAILEYLDERGATPREALNQAFPGCSVTLKSLHEKGFITIERERSFREVDLQYEVVDRQVSLNSHQEAAVDTLVSAVQQGGFHPFLLHGVTGSGKTEVYMRVIDRALAQGKGALVLVPEIALTPQLMSLFQARFGQKVAILHSALGPGERLDQWAQVAMGQRPLVLGARSAIFAPLRNPGVIVVDEEHEGSFKQEEAPYYNARDLALVRGQQSGCTVVLGSATPSLEMYHHALGGKITYVSLPVRATPKPLPDVVIVDLRKQGFVDEQRTLSRPLRDELAVNLERREQSILFLNRKGFSAFLLCERCGNVPMCPHCSISLTHYERARKLRCHYCQHEQDLPTGCPVCNHEELKRVGFGTERVVESLETLFPGAVVERLDSSVSRTSSLSQVLQRFRKGLIDILVGTQIVAKGHDFPNVTLVGVLLADLGLSFPDFRASERTFQLLTQVAGRAGRGERTGRVVVQTYMPEHHSLLKAQRHDFKGFAELEMEERRVRAYPPFSHLALFKFSGEQHDQVDACARTAFALLSGPLNGPGGGVELLGPTLAPIAIVRGKLRVQILVKTRGRAALKQFVGRASQLFSKELERFASVRWDVDVDPLSMM